MQRHGEAVGVACFGEQLLGTLRIEFRRFQLLAGTVEEFRQQLRGGNSFLFHHPIDDGVAVDRHRQGLAHARVAERILVERFAVFAGHKRWRFFGALIQVHVNHAVRHFVDQRIILVLRKLRDIGGRHGFDEFDALRQECCDPPGRAGENLECDSVPRLFPSPVAIICFHNNTLIGYVLNEFVRAGTDGGLARVVILGRCLFAVQLGDDQHRGEIRWQQHMWCGRFENDRMRIDDLYLDNGFGKSRERGRTVGHIRGAFQG